MKVVLSRKGFDSTYGGIPSPIIEGTLLSMPIPSPDDKLAYEELQYKGCTYKDILRQLSPRSKRFDKCPKCHLDPDIREDVRIKAEPNWKPAFGQIDQAQTYLQNKNVKPGDLFLFFGRFRKTKGDPAAGTLEFDKDEPIIHAIYGYMQIGEIVPVNAIKKMKYRWHPHGSGERLNKETNTLYIPADKLSFDKERHGWGTFEYSESRVLTLAERTATWRSIDCLLPEWIDKNVTNKAEPDGIYYQGQWQELVLKEDAPTEGWIKEIFGTE